MEAATTGNTVAIPADHMAFSPNPRVPHDHCFTAWKRVELWSWPLVVLQGLEEQSSPVLGKSPSLIFSISDYFVLQGVVERVGGKTPLALFISCL